MQGVALDSRGLPVWMDLKRMPLEASEIRVILSLLALGRAFTTDAKLDVEPIVSEWKGYLPYISRKEYRYIFERLGLHRWE